MSSSLDQASNLSLSQSSFQPFDSLPDEVLLLLLDQLTPFQRCLVLSICRKWNQVILGHKRWWQYLDIHPYHLPFSTALSILQTFNSRSNFTLKHVIIKSRITTSEQVDEVFVQLKKSSGHVKLLFLNQPGFMLKAMRAAQRLLPNLNTFYCIYSPFVKRHLKTMWYERGSLGILDEEEKGLQFLHVTELEQLETDDLEWFSKLKYLGVRSTDSVKDLHTILEISKRTLETLNLKFWAIGRSLEPPDLVHADGFKKITLPNVKSIFTPKSEASAAALSRLIDVDVEGKDRVFIGFVHCLLHFDFPSLERVRIHTYYNNVLIQLKLSEEEATARTTLFFKRNPSISHLSLDCLAGSRDEENFHLNFVLHSLVTEINSGAPDEIGNEAQKVLLPKLRQLSIDEPKTLDKNLLKQFWDARKAICRGFIILVNMEDKSFRIDRSGGEEWLDEADNCE